MVGLSDMVDDSIGGLEGTIKVEARHVVWACGSFTFVPWGNDGDVMGETLKAHCRPHDGRYSLQLLGGDIWDED